MFNPPSEASANQAIKKGMVVPNEEQYSETKCVGNRYCSCFGSYNAYSLGDFRGTSRPEEEWQQGVTLTTIHEDTSIDLKQSFNSRYLKK